MAFTQTDLDALDRAIASGELSIRDSDGRQVTYRSTDELLKARDKVAGILSASSTAATPRHKLADFSD